MSELTGPKAFGQTILITGSTDGLGKLVATHLAQTGATILLHGRNPEKGKKVLQEIRDKTNNPHLEYFNADFASLAEVSELADKVTSTYDQLDILINNAGIGGGPKANQQRDLSADGHELRFAVNYLASYLLTKKSLPSINRDSGRIINVASVGQETIDFDDVMLEKNYDAFHAYRQSKLAMIMFTFDLAEELKDTGITVNTLHPATLMNTNMVRDFFGRTMSTVEEGADALEYLAVSPELSDTTGVYFNQIKPYRALGQAYDKEARDKLKALSEELTGRFT
ncbi:MAG TPA: SDR family NAD(P)-dependent oxidoreductase [Bacteroidales bacterium]|nr:SDR family NAD(P)-dependent oxidoreductase [Bacteroidales bacterium]